VSFLTEQQLTGAAQNGDDGYRVGGRIVALRNVEILVAPAYIDVNNVIIFVDERLNVRLVKTVVQSKAIKAPTGSEDKKHTLVVLRGCLESGGNFPLSIRITGIELAQSR